MKTLLFCVRAPWPPMDGVDLRCWQTLHLLRRFSETGVFALAGSREPPPGFALWRVTGAAAKPLDQSAWLKTQTGLPSDGYYDEASAAELRLVLDQFSPDVVVLDHLWMHSYEAALRSSGARLVLNAHNVEAELARQLAGHETHPPAKLQRRIFATRVRAVEGELARRADQIWTCSEQDREYFIEDYAVPAPVYVVPNAVDLERYRIAIECPQELRDIYGPRFIFAGVFHYAPNQRAAEFLIRDLFPRLVAEYPDCRLVLAGSNPTTAMLQAAKSDGRIIVTGQVPDMIPYLQHSTVMLVPLFEGSGTRFKIIEAMASKLPVVSTAKGAEGLGAEAGRHFLPAEDVADFLAAIGVVLKDPDCAHEMVRAASGLVETLSWNAASETVGLALNALLGA